MSQTINNFTNAAQNGLDVVDDRTKDENFCIRTIARAVQPTAQRNFTQTKTKQQKIDEASAKLDAQVLAKIAEVKSKVEAWKLDRLQNPDA